MSALSALFAALGGRMTYSVADEAAESWDKATGSAKKYKNTILGFDEINRLNDETGGGGGGSSNINGGISETELPDWAEKIRQAIEDGDWYGAGKALADHLNELIENWDAYEAGRKLGEKINHVLEFAFGFLKNFDFGNLGKKVAEFFNGIFNTVNWDLLGRVLVRGFTGIIDFLIGFIENIDTVSIAKAISDFLKGAFDEATEWINSKDWEQIGQTLLTKIGEFFKNLDVSGIAKSVSTFLGSAIRAAILLLKPIDDWLTEKWKKEIEGADFTETMSNLFGKIGDGLGDIVAWVRDNIIRPFLDTLLDDSNWSGANELKTKVVRYMYYLEFYIRGVCEKIGWIIQDLGLIAKDVSEGDWESAWKHAQQLVSDASTDVAASAESMADRATAAMDRNSKVTIDWGATYERELNKVREETDSTMTTFTGLKETAETVFGAAGASVSSFAGDYSGFASSVVSDTDWLSEKIGVLVGKLAGLKTAFDMTNSDYGSIFGEAVRGNALGYASGGEITNDGTLFVAGEAGPEIVANLGSSTGVMNVDQMEAAVANGNVGVINAIYGMANMIVKAVDSIDMDVSLDGQSLANKMYNYNKQAANRYGTAMVT